MKKILLLAATCLILNHAWAAEDISELDSKSMLIIKKMESEIISAKEKAISELDKELKSVVKKGDLEGALAIKKQIDEISKTLPNQSGEIASDQPTGTSGTPTPDNAATFPGMIICMGADAVNCNDAKPNKDLLVGWKSGGTAEFKKTVAPGTYQVAIEMATNRSKASVTVAVGSAQVQASDIGTADMNEFKWFDLGTITVSSAATTIKISGTSNKSYVGNLKSLLLKPVK